MCNNRISSKSDRTGIVGESCKHRSIPRWIIVTILFRNNSEKKKKKRGVGSIERFVLSIELENVDDASISGVTTTGISIRVVFTSRLMPLVRHVCTRLCGHVRISETTF